jgi:hypothetical protein
MAGLDVSRTPPGIFTEGGTEAAAGQDAIPVGCTADVTRLPAEGGRPDHVRCRSLCLQPVPSSWKKRNRGSLAQPSEGTDQFGLLMGQRVRGCNGGRMTDELRYPTADRWAIAIVAAVRSDNDPRTLELWARAAAAGRGTLRGWCYAARAAPRASLDFARLLRIVCRAPLGIPDPLVLLDIVDPRTTTRLLRRAGFSLHEFSCAVGCPLQFLQRQCLVSDPTLLAATCGRVPSSGGN